MKKLPRVLVGAPTSEGHRYIIDKYLRRIKNLTYSNYDLLLVDNSEGDEFVRYLAKKKIKVIKALHYRNLLERITASRNVIINYMLQNNYDYLMSIDTDVIPPKDVIEKLLKRKKDLVGFLTHMGFKLKKPAVLKNGYILKDKYWGLHAYTWAEIKKMPDFTKVYGTSVACLLISRKVFESGVRFRYTPYFGVGEDIWFFAECNQKGFEFWLDKSVRVKHYNKDRSKIYGK